jgi:peptidoglycan/xylan/chitin deacetylase (PgdA/CDA1 family)
VTDAGDGLVLCYHAVSPSWRCSLAVAPEQLERQLSLLVRRGWVGTTFSRAALDPPATRTFAVTFDDAYLSVLEHALPILSSLEIPGTVFAPTQFMSERQPLRWPGIDQWHDTPDAGELTSMDWDDLRSLATRGWEIGSHTVSHPHLTELDDDALSAELERSREECSARVGRPCESIAYPYGDADARVAERARELGYRAGAMLGRRLDYGGDPHRHPRIGIYDVDAPWRFRLKVSPLTRTVRRTRIWPKAA